MKKLLILVAVVAIFLAIGCAGGDKPYTNPAQTISTSVNQEFVITLASNPTTGSGWQTSYDETMVELTESKYKVPEMEKHERVKQGIVSGGVNSTLP